MSEGQTSRGRAWLATIDHLSQAEPIKTDDIVDKTCVHARTARAVFRVAEEASLLSRHSSRGQKWFPAVGIIEDLSLDESDRRAIHTLIDEAQTYSGDSL